MQKKILFALVALSCASLQAEGTVEFSKDVWPILKENCIKCHGPNYVDSKGNERSAKAGLRLDSAEAITKGSKEGAVVVAGKPAESKLYMLTILPKDNSDVMPPKGELLTKQQQETLKTWILEGAKFGDWKNGQ